MTIITVISLSSILLTVSLAQLFIGYSEYTQGKLDVTADQSLELAESAIDNAIYEYSQDSTYTGGTFTSPVGNAAVTLTVNNSPDPPQVTVTATAIYSGIKRSETAIFSVSPPAQIINKAGFAENNLYAYNSILNGEIFTNNDLNITSSQLNGDLYAAGKGNGQKNYLTNVKVNQYQGSGGNINLWDPTWLQTNTSVSGNANYHTSLHIDGSSSVSGSKVKNSNSFIPPISDPTFNFSQAKTTATQNGSYYSDPTSFMNYVYALCVNKPGSCSTQNGTTTYTLPSGLYYVDCYNFFGACLGLPYTLWTTDNKGNNQIIGGSGVSIIVNSWFIDLGGINISSPYQSNGSSYPAFVTNGDNDMIQGITTPEITVNINGLVYAYGSINAYGTATNTTTITGAAWAANQLNLFDYGTITYSSTYIQNITGFNFPSESIHVLSWQENP